MYQPGCEDRTVNLDLELFGIPKEHRLAADSIDKLTSFLPGPRGFRCFRLASKAAHMVDRGNANTEYVHRPENGKTGEEAFHLPVDDEWILHVDCAGFVRNCLRYVTRNPFVLALSDRAFMRAKDFYSFFESIPYCVTDELDIPLTLTRTMKWRKVPDLRMIIPGDVICYRPKGSSAGNAAFTTSDRKDLGRLLKAVKVAQMWKDETNAMGATEDANGKLWKNLVTRNVARDPAVKEWVAEKKANLNSIGIKTGKELYINLLVVNEKLASEGKPMFDDVTLKLMRECFESRCENTGHIVFASGPAVHLGDNMFRVRVVHSTKHGKRDEVTGEIIQGVQEHFRKFKLVDNEDGISYWTREAIVRAVKLMPVMTPVPVVEDVEDDDNPNDDMEETDDENDTILPLDPADESPATGGDDCAGGSEVEVIAARMCF
jgi:hypothetical protein